MTRECVVQNVTVSQDGVEISWMVLPDDVRSEGKVVNSRSTAISFTAPAGLGERAVDVRTLVDGLAQLVLDEIEQLPMHEPPAVEPLGYQPVAVEEDDDDVGMGEGR